MYQDQDLKEHVLLKDKWTDITIAPNLREAACVNIPLTEEGVDQFNHLIELCECLIGKARIVYTKSGGIKKNGICCRYGIRVLTAQTELDIFFRGRLIRVFNGHWTPKEKGGGISGTQAFNNFKETMLKFGVDLTEYELSSLEEGLKEKKLIPPPIIAVSPLDEDVIFENVHHLDLNSAYLSGIKASYPEWGPGLDYMYLQRKNIKNMKAVMVSTVGYFHSPFDQYKHAHIAKAGIIWNNDNIIRLKAKLESSGRKVICINTDGIWYQGDIYHDEQEGTSLGQWKTDHTNCTFRAKSKGAYEYIELGVYHPVLRGPCKRDKFVDRTEWSWGDIYLPESEVLDFRFNYLTERVELLCSEYQNI